MRAIHSCCFSIPDAQWLDSQLLKEGQVAVEWGADQVALLGVMGIHPFFATQKTSKNLSQVHQHGYFRADNGFGEFSDGLESLKMSLSKRASGISDSGQIFVLKDTLI